MNQITYRRASPEDALLLTDTRIRFALELSGEQPALEIQKLREQMVGYFKKANQDNTCISILAEWNRVIAGIGSVHVRELPGNFRNLSGKWGYIMNMYTLPEYRKQGICSEILRLLVSEGKEAGIGAFELHATENGLPVYLKNGFGLHNEPTLRKFI